MNWLYSCYILLVICLMSCAPEGTNRNNNKNSFIKQGDTLNYSSVEVQLLNRAKIIGAINADTVGNYSLAMMYLDSVLTINPQNTEAYRLKAHLLSILGDNIAALEIINKAIKIDSLAPSLYIMRASILITHNDNDGALDDYKRVVRFDTNYAEAWEAIGYMEITKGNKAFGCECLSKARDLGYNVGNAKSDSILCK